MARANKIEEWQYNSDAEGRITGQTVIAYDDSGNMDYKMYSVSTYYNNGDLKGVSSKSYSTDFQSNPPVVYTNIDTLQYDYRYSTVLDYSTLTDANGEKSYYGTKRTITYYPDGNRKFYIVSEVNGSDLNFADVALWNFNLDNNVYSASGTLSEIRNGEISKVYQMPICTIYENDFAYHIEQMLIDKVSGKDVIHSSIYSYRTPEGWIDFYEVGDENLAGHYNANRYYHKFDEYGNNTRNDTYYVVDKKETLSTST